MAVVRDKVGSMVTLSGGTATSVFATNPSAGDKVIVAIWCYGSTAPTSVTDNASNTYTQDASFTGNTGDANLVVRLYRADNIALPGSGTLSVSYAGAGDRSVCAIAYTGVASGAPSATNTNFSGTAVTTGNSNAAGGASTGLQVGVFGGSTGTIATTAPFLQQAAEQNATNFPGAVSDRLDSATSATCTWTFASDRYSALIAAYNASAVAAAVPIIVMPPRR